MVALFVFDAIDTRGSLEVIRTRSDRTTPPDHPIPVYRIKPAVTTSLTHRDYDKFLTFEVGSVLAYFKLRETEWRHLFGEEEGA